MPQLQLVQPFSTQLTLNRDEIPTDELPLARLLANGAGALADSELLDLLLHPRGSTHQTLEQARAALRQLGGLNGLIGAGPTMVAHAGLDEPAAGRLLAAVELGRRLARAQVPDREPLLHPSAVARYLLLQHGLPDQEIMGALYLDTRHRLLASEEIFRGTLNRASVEPRAILKTGLLHGAAALILFHTHPSGDPAPSPEDLNATRRLADAGELVGVRLEDHLIIGVTGAWVSLRERGLF